MQNSGAAGTRVRVNAPLKLVINPGEILQGKNPSGYVFGVKHQRRPSVEVEALVLGQR